MNPAPIARAQESASIHSLDRIRILRALRHRVRYRYVQPKVSATLQPDGWLITSPCCSRNIDPTGGVIDIAWLEPYEGTWSLYFKDHVHDRWVLHDESHNLQPLLNEICVDSMRVFWP